MKEKDGVVFSIAKDNAPIPGCTVSKEAYHAGSDAVLYFSLAKGTDISAETFPYSKLLVAVSGSMEVYAGDGRTWKLEEGDCLLAPAAIPVGMRTNAGAVYTEITARRFKYMNPVIHAGEIFRLGEMVPYQDGKIVNMDILNTGNMKFVVMSFDAGTGLSEHAAPGEALIFALDGQAVIGYEGSEHKIHAGENFHFAKGGLHSVKAEGKFKMALLLTLE